LALAQESGNAPQLFGGDDGGRAVLARIRRRRGDVHGVVPAAALDDCIPAEPRGPSGPNGARRGMVQPAASTPGAIRPGRI